MSAKKNPQRYVSDGELQAIKRGISREMFEKFGIGHILDKYPSQISSGEYKRACVARAFLSEEPYIFLDEPTSNLDDENAEEIAKMIRCMKDRGVIVATHDARIKGDKTYVFKKVN